MKTIQVNFVTVCGPDPIQLTHNEVYNLTLNIDEATVYTQELLEFFKKNPLSPCDITSLALVKVDDNPDVDKVFNVMNNTKMEIYAPTDLKELRNSPTVITWPEDKADFKFKVEANNDYRRGAVA